MGQSSLNDLSRAMRELRDLTDLMAQKDAADMLEVRIDVVGWSNGFHGAEPVLAKAATEHLRGRCAELLAERRAELIGCVSELLQKANAEVQGLLGNKAVRAAAPQLEAMREAVAKAHAIEPLNGLRLEVGKFYINRREELVGPIKENQGQFKDTHPFWDGQASYTARGRWASDDDITDDDLILEAQVQPESAEAHVDATPGLKIELGKYYQRRDGAVVGPAELEYGVWCVGPKRYFANGKYRPDGVECILDLIREVERPADAAGEVVDAEFEVSDSKPAQAEPVLEQSCCAECDRRKAQSVEELRVQSQNETEPQYRPFAHVEELHAWLKQEVDEDGVRVLVRKNNTYDGFAVGSVESWRNDEGTGCAVRINGQRYDMQQLFDEFLCASTLALCGVLVTKSASLPSEKTNENKGEVDQRPTFVDAAEDASGNQRKSDGLPPPKVSGVASPAEFFAKLRHEASTPAYQAIVRKMQENFDKNPQGGYVFDLPDGVSFDEFLKLTEWPIITYRDYPQAELVQVRWYELPTPLGVEVTAEIEAEVTVYCWCGAKMDGSHACDPLDGDLRQLRDLIEDAWNLIANAGGANWENENPVWRDHAESFRKKYHELIGSKKGIAAMDAEK